MIDGWGISCEIALIWMSLDFTDDKSTLVQVMAWCRQATSHYLSQCWPRSLSPYGFTRPQRVNPSHNHHMQQHYPSWDAFAAGKKIYRHVTYHHTCMQLSGLHETWFMCTICHIFNIVMSKYHHESWAVCILCSFSSCIYGCLTVS